MIKMFARQRQRQKAQAHTLVPGLPIHEEHWCVSWTDTGTFDVHTGKRFYVITVRPCHYMYHNQNF